MLLCSTNLGTETAPRAVSSAKTRSEIREKVISSQRTKRRPLHVVVRAWDGLQGHVLAAIPAHFAGHTPGDGKAAGSGPTQHLGSLAPEPHQGRNHSLQNSHSLVLGEDRLIFPQLSFSSSTQISKWLPDPDPQQPRPTHSFGF